MSGFGDTPVPLFRTFENLSKKAVVIRHGGSCVQYCDIPRSSALLLGVLLSSISFYASADMPGKHPFYLHALTDLRTARWMLEHRPGDAAVSGQEDVAITEIDAAIGEIKRAAIDDGKDIHDHPKVDGPADRPGRLHKALELLRKTHGDVAREEDDPMTKGLRNRAVGHIDGAIHATEGAIHDVKTGR